MHTTATERSALLALHAAALAAEPDPEPTDDEADDTAEPVTAADMQVQVGNESIDWADFWAMVDADEAQRSQQPRAAS